MKLKALWWAAGLAVVILLAGYLILRHSAQQKQATHPDIAATLATADLLKTAQNLEGSFTPNDAARPEQTTKQYLSYLQSMLQDCRTLKNLQPTSWPSSLDETTLSRLSDSAKLCGDLAKVAGNSATIYLLTEPLLTTDPHLMRYETLPGLNRLKRHQQITEVSQAISQLNQPVKRMEFNTGTVTYLKQLRASMRTNLGLSYYPALRTFQSQLIMERQRYWIDYGDINALIHTLSNQFDGYCQSSSIQLKICQQQS